MSNSTEPVMQGYMLKKKRKKMQGMARRYFRLSPSGALSYGFNPNSPVRDSVYVSLAFVSASTKHRSFHIDSGKSVMHCKALNREDFDQWTNALKQFIGNVPEQHLAGGDKGLKGKSRPRARTTIGDGQQQHETDVDMITVFSAIAKMTQPLHDLDHVYTELRGEPLSPNSPKLVNKLIPGRKSSTASKESYFDAKSNHGDLVKQYATALSVLQEQHRILSHAINKNTPAVTGRGGAASDEFIASRSFGSSGSRPPYGGGSRGNSSTYSIDSEDGGNEEWEDAPQVPGEFVLDGNEEDGSESEATEDDEEESSSEAEGEEDSDTSATSASEGEGDSDNKKQKGPSDSQVTLPKDNVKRRDQLPAPVAGDEFSMLGMLRKNVGKDLSTISFPVTLNEPLSFLQRMCEELEYSDLLHKAASAESSSERLVLVTAFAIAGLSGNKLRQTRKPFNPLLCETYECIRPDKGFKYIAEKVSHHPPVMALYCEAKGWRIEGSVAPSQKFWGRSMEIFVEGDYRITFTWTGKDNKKGTETYTVKRPSSFIRNLVAGTKYLEIVGDMIVKNVDSGAKATVNFKEGSSWGGASSRNKIEGKVSDDDGKTVAELVGRWDESVDRKEGKSNFERLWEIDEFPKGAEKHYGFSKFAVQLNETTELEKDKMAPTDSRLRPDQLALESGDVDKAEQEKKRVEEKQREKRNKSQAPKPKWFEKKDGDRWSYTSKYFEQREKGEFEDPDIF